MTQYRRPPQRPDDFFGRIFSRLGEGGLKLGPLVAALVGLLLLATGFYQVGPGEVAVIRTLGRETGRAESGLHFAWPLIQAKDIVNVEVIRRIEVGFRGDQAMPLEAQMLTGDENIVEAHMIVQYRISDPSKFLFRLSNVDEALHATSEVALRSVIGRTTIDDAITRGRSKVQEDTRQRLQQLLDTYQSGLHVTEVKLQSVDPPGEVKDAFHEVVRAREEKEKVINQAMGYREDVIPRARGQAEKQVREAEAYMQERVLRAQGDAKRFEQVYTEYQKAKDVTRRRMYLETMERVVGRTPNKTLVDGNLPGSTLPVLQLGATAAGVTTAPRSPSQATATQGTTP